MSRPRKSPSPPPPRQAENVNRGGRPRLIGDAGLCAFLEGLRRGLALGEAARRAGHALASFYNRRKTDPVFDAAWEEAVEISALRLGSGQALRRGSGQALRLRSGQALRRGSGQEREARPRGGGVRRRFRLRGPRRRRFLEALARECNTTAAAAEAGVWVSTVYRTIGREPGFAREVAEALERGYERLEEVLASEREKAPERLRALVEGIDPKGEMTGDFDEQMRILARYRRRDGSLGPRFVSHGRRRRWTFDEAIELVAKRLRALGVVSG